MIKVLFRRPCHIPPCLINGEGGSMWSKGMDACVVFLTSLLQSTVLLMFKKKRTVLLTENKDFFSRNSCFLESFQQEKIHWLHFLTGGFSRRKDHWSQDSKNKQGDKENIYIAPKICHLEGSIWDGPASTLMTGTHGRSWSGWPWKVRTRSDSCTLARHPTSWLASRPCN